MVSSLPPFPVSYELWRMWKPIVSAFIVLVFENFTPPISPLNPPTPLPPPQFQRQQPTKFGIFPDRRFSTRNERHGTVDGFLPTSHLHRRRRRPPSSPSSPAPPPRTTPKKPHAPGLHALHPHERDVLLDGEIAQFRFLLLLLPSHDRHGRLGLCW